MGFIAKDTTTNIVYYGKGATKIASKIGCSSSTITKFFQKQENLHKDKFIKGWIVNKTIDFKGLSRGKNVKFLI